MGKGVLRMRRVKLVLSVSHPSPLPPLFPFSSDPRTVQTTTSLTYPNTGLTRALAAELGEKNIRVNVLIPGYTETDMTDGTFLLLSFLSYPSTSSYFTQFSLLPFPLLPSFPAFLTHEREASKLLPKLPTPI